MYYLYWITSSDDVNILFTNWSIWYSVVAVVAVVVVVVVVIVVVVAFLILVWFCIIFTYKAKCYIRLALFSKQNTSFQSIVEKIGYYQKYCAQPTLLFASS